MSIEADAQKDLALNADDAENVVGGKTTRMNKNKKTAKNTAAHKTAGHSLPTVNIQIPTTPVPLVDTPLSMDDCGTDGVAAVDSVSSDAG